jgi:mannose-6-phosphate isomerase-like protein (cupin superfamily)
MSQRTNLHETGIFTGPDGARIQELVGRTTGITSHSLARIIHPAGTHSRTHHHTLCDEVYYVASGAGSIKVDQECLQLGPGDVITILPFQTHQVAAAADQDLEMIVTCSPAYDVSEVLWDE